MVATEEASDSPWTAPPSRTRQEPPIRGPLPPPLDVVLADQDYVPKQDSAHRRDRRKDALLQEHGTHILRFLAEDLATDLDGVLDSIPRALTHWLKPPAA